MSFAHRSFSAPAAAFAAGVGALVLLIGPAVAAGPLPPGHIGDPVAVAAPAGFAPTLLGCGITVVAAVNAGLEQQIVDLVNQQRLTNGSLPPLKRVSPLDNAARYHSLDMIQDNYFDHATYDRVNNILTLTCDFALRVGSYYVGWNAVGENIAAGQTTPAQVMTDWMNSSGHRANILSTTYRETGAGYANGGSYRHYWTSDFGQRRTVYPLVINREAANTASATVQLYVYGTWSEIRLRNENDSFGAWQPFSNNLGWTLSAGAPGPRTVSAEMRSGGTATAASDDITLDTGSSGPSATPVPPGVTPTATQTPTRTPTGVPTTVTRGDCNADGGRNAADLSALTLELWDGDGPDAGSAGQGTYPGSPVGCDSNHDGIITAGDLSCTVLIIFDGPGACP
jgi:uncharacterized protein YkwD